MEGPTSACPLRHRIPRIVLLNTSLLLLNMARAGTATAGCNVWTSTAPEGEYIRALTVDPKGSSRPLAAAACMSAPTVRTAGVR